MINLLMQSECLPLLQLLKNITTAFTKNAVLAVREYSLCLQMYWIVISGGFTSLNIMYKFIYGLFNDAVPSSDYTGSNGKMISK
jgi:hypothetical protein